MKQKGVIRDVERYVYELMTAPIVVEYFGEDYLRDYGIDIPNELIEQYHKNMVEFKEIQLKLHILSEARLNKV